MNRNLTLEKIIEMPMRGYDRDLYHEIKAGWDRVAKPLDSMGRFEDLISRIGAVQEKSAPELGKARLLVCCADNGIVEEGVSQSGQEITAICAESIANGRSSVAIMARQVGIDVLTVDVGINSDKPLWNVRNAKIRQGTRDFLREPAMTPKEALLALETGMELVEESKKEGYSILCIGEMGIGNTTTSSAVTAALLGLSAETVTGRGAGLNDEKLRHKKEVIRAALEKYGFTVAEGAAKAQTQAKETLREKSAERAMEVLCNVGGFDIACMAGICIGGAAYHVPVVLDGFISLAAALVACRIKPVVKEYLIPSHSGKEPAMKRIEEELGLSPVIYANMALGEGTGAVMMMGLLRTAGAVYEKSTSFDGAGIEQYVRYDKKQI